MRRTMTLWGLLLLLGIALIVIFPWVRPPEAGIGALPLVPIGYFTALIGAVGLLVAWMRGRSR